MRTTTAFFAGVGTIVVAIATGVGGGVMIAGMVSPHGPKSGAEMSRVERQTSQPTPGSNAASQPVNYIEATQAAAVNPVTVSPAPSQAQQPQPQQQTSPAAEQAHAAPANASQTVGQATNSPHRDANASAQPATNAQPSQTAAREPVSSDNASNKSSEAKSADTDAKARNADSKREARREAREARRAEREARRDEHRHERQQRYAERRRYRELIDVQLRDADRSRDAERSDERDDNDGQQLLAAEPAETQQPRINLFGND